MRSFFHKDFTFQHKYPIKVWSAGVIDDIPYSVSFDGSTLRQINLLTKKVTHSFDYHHLNAYSICFYMSTNIYKYENLFLLVKNQRYIEIYDYSLKHVPQFDYDVGSAIIALHWHKPSDRLFACGTNGWLRCFKVTTKHKVTEFVAEWTLLWEIRSTSDWIISLAHDDFTQLLYGAVEDSIYAWDLNTGDFKYRLPQMHNKYKICQVEVDPESSVVITSGQDGYIRTWNIKELECKNLNSFEVAPEGHVSFTMIGRQIVTIGNDRIIKFFGISDSTLRCSVEMSDPTKKIDLDEVINPQLVVLGSSNGNICVTSYKEQLQTAILSFAPEDILSTDSTVSSMDFDWKENSLLCLCSNNFVIASREKGYSKTIDLDVPNTNQCKRCPVSEVMCFIVNGDILYAGFKNGSVKCINLRKKECIMLDQVPLDEPIVYITIVHGIFLFNHPICGEVSPIKTSKNDAFIVCYTIKGIINVWCARCHTHLLSFEIGKNPITCLKLVPEKSLLLISAQKNLTIYSINAYDFIPVGEITTSGNQIITSFEVTNNMELIAGTSSGEIMILLIEEGENELHFHLKHHIAFDAGIFNVYFNMSIGKPVICLKNGSLIAMNQTTAKTISRSNHVDAEPLTAVYIKYDQNENKVGAYLAFGSRIHYAPVDTYEEPIEAKKEEEEEKEEEKEVENDDTDEKAENVIKYFEESQLNISRLMLLVQKEKNKKKRRDYIPEMQAKSAPKSQEKVPEKRSKSQTKKLSYNEVMEKNRNAIQEALGIFDYSRPYSASSKKKSYFYYSDKYNSENNDFNSPKKDDNSLSLVVKPFFYTDLPENSHVMVPPLKKSSQSSSKAGQNNDDDNDNDEEKNESSQGGLQTSRRINSSSSSFSYRKSNFPEKNLVYGDPNQRGFQAAIDENENAERTTPDYIPPGGRFVLEKLKKEPFKAPTIIKKIFVGPPQSSRVLFNDPSTLNGLSFFDPRGFQTRFGESESAETSTTNQSSVSSSRAGKNEEEEEEAPDSESQSESDSDLFFLGKKKMTELERRRMLKKRRVSITAMMTAPSRPRTSQQANRRISLGYINEAQLKQNQTKIPKTPQPAMKNNYISNSASDQQVNLQRPKVNSNQNSQNNRPQTPKPAILITNAHIERKDKVTPVKPQIQTEKPKPVQPKPDTTNTSNTNKPETSPPPPTATTDTANKNDVQKEESIEKVDDQIENKVDVENKIVKDSSKEKLPSIQTDKKSDDVDSSENQQQSPKHVQFVIPPKSPKSEENEYNSDSVKSPTESEIEVELPIIDIKLRHEMFPQRRRKVKNQPIHLATPESTLTSYIKGKIAESEQYAKQKSQNTTPRTPPKDENEAVKASMMSPNHPSKKNLSKSSSTASQSSIDMGQQKKKKKKGKSSSKSNSSAMSEASSTADSTESNLNSLSQDDQSSTQEAKPTKVATSSNAISKDEEQARINQERRKKMFQDGDGFFSGLFGSSSDKDKDKDKSEEKKESEEKKLNLYYPQLQNLQKFWEQNMVFPILPFDFGDPNTAKPGEEKTVFDDGIEKVEPIQSFHLFAGTEKNGVNDLVRRFQKISAFNRGERDTIDDVFDADNDEDVLSNLPSFKRRLSF